MKLNKKDIERFKEYFNHSQPTEIRVFDKKKYPKGKTIFIKTEKNFVEKIEKYQKENVDCYIGFRDRINKGDDYIISSQEIFFEIDEHNIKKPEEKKKVEKFLKENNIEIGMSGFSGGGFHFYIPHIKKLLENKKDRDFYKRVLIAFKNGLVNNGIDIDSKVFNLERVSRILGTYNYKRKQLSKILIYNTEVNRKENHKSINKIIKKYEKKIIKIDKTAIELLEKYKINETDKWLYDLLKKGIVVKEDTGGNSIVFKNTAIILTGENISKAEREVISKAVVELCEDRNLSQLYSWIKKCEDSEIYVVYKNELNKFIKDNNYDLTPYKLTKEDKKENLDYIKEQQPEKIFTKLGQAKRFIELQPLFYDKKGMFWLWNFEEFKYEFVDDIEVLNSITEKMDMDTINSKERIEILQALKQEGRKNIPEEAKKTWIQFKDKIYDIENKENFNASSEYFITNPIPYELGKKEDTPTLDKLFTEWAGKEHIKELYEVISFCLVADYFIHRIICLIGSGANGKGTYLKVIKKFIGKDNKISTSLDRLLTGRFESAKLYKKLICLMGETNFNTIKRTELLKSMTGEDTIGAEFKNKNPFDFENFAKLIIATNSLPMTQDKTEGYYRRWKIVDFINKFEKERDVLKNIPEEEYNNLALKCLKIARALWKNRIFTNDGNFEERKKRYEEKSNPLMLFIKEKYKKSLNQDTSLSDFCEGLQEFLIGGGYRELTNRAVSSQLKEEGFEIKKTTKDNITTTRILGLKRDSRDPLLKYPQYPKYSDSHLGSIRKNLSEPSGITGITGIAHNQEKLDVTEEKI